jgi:hypothetical protein
MAITDIKKTYIYVIENINNVVDSLKASDRIYFENSSQKLYRYTNSEFKLVGSNIFYTDTNELPTSASTGSLGIKVTNGEPQLFAKLDSGWVLASSAGSKVSIIDGKTAPALTGKEIAGEILITKENNVIWYFDGSKWVSTQELITVTSTIDIGGIKKNTSFTDKTNAELWAELLNKELFPTFVAPSSTFTSVPSNGTLKEIGEEISIEFNSTFNRGSIIGQGYELTGDDIYRAGLPTKRVYEGTDLAGEDTSSELTVEKSISDYVVAKGSQTWSCTVSYGTGSQPKTNKGGTKDANGNEMTALPAGTLEKKSVSITGTYPFFATTSSIESATKQSLVNLDPKTIKAAMVGCTDKNFWVLEVPACWTITNVTGAASGQLGGNAANAIAQWTRRNTVKTIQGNNIKYYKYTYGANNAPKKGADTLTFNISYNSAVSLSTPLAEGATWE